MNDQSIAPNETMQLHEILTFKNTCLTKALTMSPLVSDEELKSILQQEVSVSEKHIEELRSLMEKSNIAFSEE
ncbi:spore coat protein [Clostridium beijerinckii]|uniref:spore coat protein n=1 Tax=Clostridium beijerinckii TaxID=1520 RepID=UPI0003FB1F11|nr:spore coat protein [Clostridium beijerinckii]MZK48983.1 spore coat protein [Clostridium beijerinckii]MZK57358.1 spore coat protein [Clostridium beijerinckii]MZK67569.1 spore coat protein [Clostridium beijerinckii]MZK72654.1 spore coat protein [Clostridium beijerinckii]MZK82250.1 spore coat protein [Clostridium beijerinckii]